MVVDTIKCDSVKNKGITGWQECNNCTTEVLIAIWDDEALSGRLLPVCGDCMDDVPEFNLWDASKMDSHPIPPHKEWVVLPKHRNRTKQLKSIFGNDIPTKEELEDKFNFVNDDASHFFEESDELNLGIYIRNPDNESELKAARKEARNILNE